MCSSESCAQPPRAGCRLRELPAARPTFDKIIARAEADLAFRTALIADLEEALAQEGYEPSAGVVAELRERLAES